MRSDNNRLIPELAEWNDGAGINVESWISCVGRYDHFLGYISILWPDFVLFDNCIFYGIPDAKSYQEFMEMLHGNKTEVERVMNHQHIADMFRNSGFHLTEKDAIFIGTNLREMWSCKLKTDFPERRFNVEFISSGELSGESDESLLRYVATFSQQRGTKR